MKELIIQLFKKKSAGKGHYCFVPELKIKRTNDIIYVSEIVESSFIRSSASYFVMVEVGTCETKVKMPLALLDDLSLKAIYKRLQCKDEVLLSIENK